MLNEKAAKEELRKSASRDPEKYYPVKTLLMQGFTRKQCSKCNRFFWSLDASQTICGDPQCIGGFHFIGKSVVRNELSYIDVWKAFSKTHSTLGYVPIKRYPVVAGWNPTMDFTIASIAAFQPFVVSGEVEPPANPLVIPQFCLRFSDIDNVGITGHFTGFVMMGEHAFCTPEKYDINKYISDHLVWLTQGMGVKKEELVLHEDAWAGGGNLGTSIEFFVDGLEISNQVYMQFALTENGLKDLGIKVLDMGQGQERAAWISQRTFTPYDATFPTVMKKLYNITGVKINEDFMKRYLPNAPFLNLDEAPSAEEAWKYVANKLKLEVKELRTNLEPLAALYSIAEHSRSILVALSDTALPSNTGGGYNLRILLRRIYDFIEKYGWNIDVAEICEWHADYLKPLFPELSENIEDIKKVLSVEHSKYLAGRQKIHTIVQQYIKKDITPDALVQLYDSQGVSPELIREEAAKQGKHIIMPDDFYARVAALHEKKEAEEKKQKEEFPGFEDLPATEVLYYGDTKKTSFTAKILKQIGKNIVLDKTYFYPTSGGQMHDTGKIDGKKLVNVVKYGSHVVHILDNEVKMPVGKEIKCEIDADRRLQLSQHHTAAHIINAAARSVLGNHINQASAHKDVDKARIDLTHYRALTTDELDKIEKTANDLIKKRIKINKSFMQRTKAEQQYGMRIYQGGVPVGKELRIVEIPGIDVECCGGSHLDNTEEVGLIKLVRSTKVSDAAIRIEYVAGRAARSMIEKEGNILEEAAKILKCEGSQVPGRALELFELWKDVVKKGKERKSNLVSKEKTSGSPKELVEKSAQLLKTQPEFLVKTIQRFLDELKQHEHRSGARTAGK